MLTTSRHSLNESSNNGPIVIKTNAVKASQETNWAKKERTSSQFSSGIGSVIPSDIKTDESSNSFDGSTRSPVTSSASGGKTSPSTESQSSNSQTSRDREIESTSGKRNSRSRYDGVYYTHEPIRGAPPVDFDDKVLDLEINHRNTEV